MIAALLLLLGFVLLYYGANFLIIGATSISTLLRLSKSFVGLTLVAFGTSAPELFVNLAAAFRGYTDLALSNVAGSNLTNLCLGFGIISVTSILAFQRGTFMTDLLFYFLAPLLVLVFFIVYSPPQLPYWSVIVFAAVICYYVFSLKKRKDATTSPEVTPKISGYMATVQLFGGIIVLYFGGKLVSENAVELATLLGMPESLIGVTIVACGTSIPDVTASIIAAARKENDIAVGNLLGSNISNAVCGLSLLFVILSLGIQKSTRIGGIILLISFAAYYTLRIYFAQG